MYTHTQVPTTKNRAELIIVTLHGTSGSVCSSSLKQRHWIDSLGHLKWSCKRCSAFVKAFYLLALCAHWLYSVLHLLQNLIVCSFLILLSLATLCLSMTKHNKTKRACFWEIDSHANRSSGPETYHFCTSNTSGCHCEHLWAGYEVMWMMVCLCLFPEYSACPGVCAPRHTACGGGSENNLWMVGMHEHM